MFQQPLTKERALTYYKTDLRQILPCKMKKHFAHGVTAEACRTWFSQPRYIHGRQFTDSAPELSISWEEFVPIVGEVLSENELADAMMRL